MGRKDEEVVGDAERRERRYKEGYVKGRKTEEKVDKKAQEVREVAERKRREEMGRKYEEVRKNAEDRRR